MFKFIHLYVYLSERYIYIYAFVCLLIWKIYLHLYICLFIYLKDIFTFIHLYVYLSDRLFTFIHLYVYLSERYIYIYTFVCLLIWKYFMTLIINQIRNNSIDTLYGVNHIYIYFRGIERGVTGGNYRAPPPQNSWDINSPSRNFISILYVYDYQKRKKINNFFGHFARSTFFISILVDLLFYRLVKKV